MTVSLLFIVGLDERETTILDSDVELQLDVFSPGDAAAHQKQLCIWAFRPFALESLRLLLLKCDNDLKMCF